MFIVQLCFDMNGGPTFPILNTSYKHLLKDAVERAINPENIRSFYSKGTGGVTIFEVPSDQYLEKMPNSLYFFGLRNGVLTEEWIDAVGNRSRTPIDASDKLFIPSV